MMGLARSKYRGKIWGKENDIYRHIIYIFFNRHNLLWLVRKINEGSGKFRWNDVSIAIGYVMLKKLS